MAQQLKTDRVLFITTIAMVTFGIVIIYSASSVMADQKLNSPWHYVLRQCIRLLPC